jgi:methylamine dehydrogenase accessory protein MauD
MGSLVLGARLLLAVVFATAAVAKLFDRPGSRRALADFGVPERVVPVVAFLLPLCELGVAAALVPQPTARWGALAALVLLSAFIAGIANAMRRGQAPDCHCFGQLHSAPAERGTLARNGALAALAAIAVIEGPGPAVHSWVAERSAAELVAIGLGIVTVPLAALSVQLLVKNRGLRRELDAARSEAVTVKPGLPIGTTAPDFALRGLSGDGVTLGDLLTTGRPVALMFMDPGCGPCQALLPDVRRWQTTLAERLTLVLVSRGTPQDNSHWVEEHGMTNVLLQKDSEAMSAFRLDGTPSAVVVSPEGRIASDAAVGASTIEPLIRLTLDRLSVAELRSQPEGAGPVRR